MRDHFAENNGTEAAESLHVEVEELRRRLAALEALVPGQADGRATARRRRERLTAKGFSLLVGGVVLVGATVVFGQGAVEALFVSREGNVGVGTTTPANRLSVAGNADVSGTLTSGTLTSGTVSVTDSLTATNSLRADGQSFLFSGGSADRSNNVVLRKDGINAYLFPWGTGIGNNTVIIGGGANTNLSVTGDLKVGGGLNIGGDANTTNLSVTSNLKVGGRLSYQGRYQRDDASEMNSTVSPRYHLSLTANAYAGRTRQIPQQILNDLCGDEDGCEVRLAMRNWAGNSGTQAASKSALLYYSESDGHWRTNAGGGGGESSGIDGQNGTQHIIDAWGTCFFTDGTYSEYQNKGDSEKGLNLLVWNNYTYQNRVCELTLID